MMVSPVRPTPLSNASRVPAELPGTQTSAFRLQPDRLLAPTSPVAMLETAKPFFSEQSVRARIDKFIANNTIASALETQATVSDAESATLPPEEQQLAFAFSSNRWLASPLSLLVFTAEQKPVMSVPEASVSETAKQLSSEQLAGEHVQPDEERQEIVVTRKTRERVFDEVEVTAPANRTISAHSNRVSQAAPSLEEILQQIEDGTFMLDDSTIIDGLALPEVSEPLAASDNTDLELVGLGQAGSAPETPQPEALEPGLSQLDEIGNPFARAELLVVSMSNRLDATLLKKDQAIATELAIRAEQLMIRANPKLPEQLMITATADHRLQETPYRVIRYAWDAQRQEVYPEEIFTQKGIHEIERPVAVQMMRLLQGGLNLAARVIPTSITKGKFPLVVDDELTLWIGNRWKFAPAKTYQDAEGNPMQVFDLLRLPNGVLAMLTARQEIQPTPTSSGELASTVSSTAKTSSGNKIAEPATLSAEKATAKLGLPSLQPTGVFKQAGLAFNVPPVEDLSKPPSESLSAAEQPTPPLSLNARQLRDLMADMVEQVEAQGYVLV